MQPRSSFDRACFFIQVSGDGKLPMTAATPGNNAATGYDNLILYLVSAQTNLNFSLSNNSDILSQESGSTVKHINWNVPSCISPGAYNVSNKSFTHVVYWIRGALYTDDPIRRLSHQQSRLLHHYTRSYPDQQPSSVRAMHRRCQRARESAPAILAFTSKPSHPE